MGRRDYRHREGKKQKKDAKKVHPISTIITPPPPPVEVIKKVKKRPPEEEE